MKSRSPARLAGVLLAGLSLWLLAAGRWGSYLGWPDRSLYLTDIVLLVSVALLLLDVGVSARHFRSSSPLVIWPLVLLAAYASVRLLLDLERGVVAARDGAPYLYCLVAVATIAAGLRGVATGSLGAVTLFHSSWVTAALVDPAFNDRFYVVGRTQLMELRTDFDAMVCGVLAAACLLLAYRRTPGRLGMLRRVILLLVASWSAALVPAMNNRAGLLAFILAILWLGLFAAAHTSRQTTNPVTRRRLLLFAGSALVLVSLVGAYTPAGQRLVGTFDESSNPEVRTTNARLAVYDKVFDYVNESAARQVFGVGFGPDYLRATDATPIYDPGGTLKVRSPHNFLLGTYARLGAIGVLLQSTVVLFGFGLAWRARRADPSDLAAVVAALVLVAVPVAAAVGVVLESPFGAVPYFWAYGVLVLRFSRSGATCAEAVDSAGRSGLVTVPAKLPPGDAVSSA